MKPSDYLTIEPTINLRASKTAQKMNIWKGIVLIGATTDKKCIKNGTRYKIIDIVQNVITLYQINDKDEQQCDTFTMTPQEVGEKLLLSHAITYDSSQARTIYGPLRLMQTDHKMMTLRRLIVGLGRAPDGALVQVY